MNATISNSETDSQEQLRKYIVQMGIDVNDPIFNLYAIMGETQTLVQQLPGQISKIAGGWTEMVDNKLAYASQVALQKQETAIADAAKSLIKSTQTSIPLSFSLSNFKLAQVAGVVGVILAFGVGIGAFVASLSGGGNAVNSTASLSKSDAQLLEWARSASGQTARNVYAKNGALINGCANEPKLKGTCLIDITGTVVTDKINKPKK